MRCDAHLCACRSAQGASSVLQYYAIWAQTCLCAWPELEFPGFRHSLSVFQVPVADWLLRGVCHWAWQIPAPDTHSTWQLGKRAPSLDPVLCITLSCVHLLTYIKLIALCYSTLLSYKLCIYLVKYIWMYLYCKCTVSSLCMFLLPQFMRNKVSNFIWVSLLSSTYLVSFIINICVYCLNASLPLVRVMYAA